MKDGVPESTISRISQLDLDCMEEFTAYPEGGKLFVCLLTYEIFYIQINCFTHSKLRIIHHILQCIQPLVHARYSWRLLLT